MSSFAKHLLTEHITELLNKSGTAEYEDKERNLYSFSCIPLLFFSGQFLRPHSFSSAFQIIINGTIFRYKKV